MKFLLRLLTFIIALQFSFTTFAQKDSCNLTVSLLTCGPGEELYSIFGHSGLRVTESQTGLDIVFNYGMFDFDDPDFYTKFIKGNLLYFSAIEYFDGPNGFLASYKAERRTVQEQILNLSCEEKQHLYDALKKNALPENRYYLYEFLYDNCSTRLRDIVEKNSNGSLVTKDILHNNSITFRNLLYSYLNKAHQYWNKLGIDILLGAPLEKKVTTREAMFLPEYLLRGFDSSVVNGKPLVAQKHTLYKTPAVETSPGFFTPMLFFISLFVIVGACTLIKKTATKIFLKIFDHILFLSTGTLGILLLFMWFGTNHIECRYNLNLLWAVPTHFFIAFFVGSNKNWVKMYFKLTAWLCLLLLICWFFLPQTLNIALIPFAGILFIRSQKLSQKK